MRILAIEHHDAPSLGIVGETVDAEGADIRVLWGAHGDALPDSPGAYDGLIVLGGAMNALDDECCPYFPELLSLIRKFTNQDLPVMGICLGAQLIARAFSGCAHLNGLFEYGFHPIQLTEEGKFDPVMAHMAEHMNLFQWHPDHYDLPFGAVKLAWNRPGFLSGPMTAPQLNLPRPQQTRYPGWIFQRFQGLFI